MKRSLLLCIVVAASAFAAFGQPEFTVNDLINVKRVGSPAVSPDGKKIAYTVGVVDKATNRTNTQIFIMSADGSDQKQITSGSASSSGPVWSPNGKRIAFVSGGQIWTMKPDGDDKDQITKISTGASGPVWSPNGKWIAFSSEVYPECATDECNRTEDEKAENSKVKAHVSTRLLYRHWVEWRDRKRTHVFIVDSDGGSARDVTPGDFDSPPYSASTGNDFAFSPDNSSIVYLRNPDKVEAVSTNSDIYTANLNGGNPKNVTAGMNGYDTSPVYSPNGKYILFLSQATPGFESDRWRIMRYNTSNGEIVELTQGFDQQASNITLSPDGKTIYFTANFNGHNPIFSVPVEPDFRLRIATHVKPVVDNVYAGNLGLSDNGRQIVFTSSSNAQPAEIFSASTDKGDVRQLTHVNDAAMAAFKLRSAEDFEWMGAIKKAHGFLLKPANFDSSKRYPLIVLIHGGPQGAWGDNWGYRWNPQIFANRGYVVFMPNPRGSTGYGQAYVNDVSGDWGGKAYRDIMNGVAAVSKLGYINKNEIGAAGASYGGYMVDWILGHNNDPRFKFKAFVSHAGVYNLESMAGATEELWFVRWEFKGMPWDNPTLYNRWSPHKFAKNFNTPTLVTAGELDYRVPVDQSLQLFTALQLHNVDSKLIVFPDEGHWILKPQNSEFWYGQVMDWFDKHLK